MESERERERERASERQREILLSGVESFDGVITIRSWVKRQQVFFSAWKSGQAKLEFTLMSLVIYFFLERKKEFFFFG